MASGKILMDLNVVHKIIRHDYAEQRILSYNLSSIYFFPTLFSDQTRLKKNTITQRWVKMRHLFANIGYKIQIV